MAPNYKTEINPQFPSGTLRSSVYLTLKVVLKRIIVLYLYIRLYFSIVVRSLTWLIRSRPPNVSRFQRVRLRLRNWRYRLFNANEIASNHVSALVSIFDHTITESNPVNETTNSVQKSVQQQNHFTAPAVIQAATEQFHSFAERSYLSSPAPEKSLTSIGSTMATPTKPPTRAAAAPTKPVSKIVSVEIPGHRKFRLQVSNKASSRALGQIKTSIAGSDTNYINEVTESIRSVFALESHDDGSLAPIIVRLAWHCCATYDKESGTGGSNGSTMRFLPEMTDEGNYGLDMARAALEPVKFKFPRITYSDLWTLAGKVAIEHMGGPTIKWICGRVDCPTDWYVPPNGRLPFGSKDADHVRKTFERMGFNDREAVALIGCHAIGRCHKRLSGWEGKWTRTPTIFTNAFFRALLEEEWVLDTVPETGRHQFYNRDKSLMMLNTDMELLRDEEFRSHVVRYAYDEKCFFDDFADAFAKLLELGITRDAHGNVLLRNILPLVPIPERP